MRAELTPAATSLAVRDVASRLQQQRRERVPQVVDANLPQLRLPEHPLEHLPHVALFERRVLAGREHPRRDLAGSASFC